MVLDINDSKRRKKQRCLMEQDIFEQLRAVEVDEQNKRQGYPCAGKELWEGL